MWTDTHCHLDFPDFSGDFQEVLSRAQEAGVTRFITIGTTVESSRRAVALAESHPAIFAAVGIHPNNAHLAPPGYLEELRTLAASRRVVALGEMGLDHHYLPSSRLPESERQSIEADRADQTVREAQERVFGEQLALAAELGLNVVVHERDAWDPALRILTPFNGKLRAVFHCFGKSPAHARELIDHSHLVSFTGILTFKNAGVVQETARQIPDGTFFVETDCPFLAPVPHRGKRAEPAHAAVVGHFLAGLRSCPPEALAAQTEETTAGFFRFPEH
jgi:TatD DNase family protein